MLDSKQKKLFDAKISYSEKLFNTLLGKTNLKKDTTDTIVLCFWNSPRNYYLCKRKFPKASVKIVEGIELENLYNLPKEDTIYIRKQEDLLEMNKLTNLHIISNPPYGAIGANITDTIREKVNYVEFVNLLPANDYKRNTNKDLFNYIDLSSMESVYGGFADAAIITTVAKISKTKNSLSLVDFELINFSDTALTKYFKKNSEMSNPYETKCDIISGKIGLNIIVPTRTSSGDHSGEHHLPYNKTAVSYKINHGEILTYDEAKGDSKKLGGCSILVNNKIEHDNIVNFMYSEQGFKFLSKVFTAIHKDTLTEITYWFPKVNWSKSWTVEEILTEYGYTNEEINEVIKDLDNFKGLR